MIVTIGGRGTRSSALSASVTCSGVRRVLRFAYGLEAELTSDQLDLIEVHSLVDRHHEPEVLERETDDLRRGNLEDLGELADGDEFVDVNGFPLAFTIRLALRLHLLARRHVVGAPWAAAPLRGTAERGHGLEDVGGHCFLIDCPALALLAPSSRLLLLLLTTATTTPTAGSSAATLPLLLRAVVSTGRRHPAARRGRGHRTRRDKRVAARDRTRARSAGTIGRGRRPIPPADAGCGGGGWTGRIGAHGCGGSRRALEALRLTRRWRLYRRGRDRRGRWW